MSDPEPEQKSLSIGYLSPGWPSSAFPNGIVTYIDTMDRALRQAGHRVSILAWSLEGLDAGDRIYSFGDHMASRSLGERLVDSAVYRLSPEAGLRRLNRRGLLSICCAAIQQQGLHLIEMEESFGYSELIRTRLSIPICLRLHGPWFLNGPALNVPQDAARDRRIRAEYLAIRHAEAISSSSADVLKRTREYYGLSLEEAEVIHPPTAPVASSDRWSLERCDRDLILFVGRFDRHKGGDLILEAFRYVLNEVPGARLRFIGPDRGLRDDSGKTWSILEFVRSHHPGLLESGKFEWLGQQPQPSLAEHRRGAMTTVICSRYENLPVAVVEAASLGCPVVAARVGGIPEIIDDQENGLLHIPGDSRDLAAKILQMLRNPGRAAELGRRAGVDCERRFYPDVVVGKMLDFYRRTLKRRSLDQRTRSTL